MPLPYTKAIAAAKQPARAENSPFQQSECTSTYYKASQSAQKREHKPPLDISVPKKYTDVKRPPLNRRTSHNNPQMKTS